jgi:hypothetical protein
MDWFRRGVPEDRRRRLRSYSRYAETPADLVIALNPAGTGYDALGDGAEEEFRQGWELLRSVLEGAGGARTRREILDDWPPDCDPPNPATVWRWLERAVAADLLTRTGTGRRNEPFRYALGGPEPGPPA